MSKTDKLIKKAKTSPTNFTFNEICLLATRVGFVLRNQTGSHKIYKHPIYEKMMNFQPDKQDKSKAKRKQIDQLLEFIDEFILTENNHV